MLRACTYLAVSAVLRACTYLVVSAVLRACTYLVVSAVLRAVGTLQRLLEPPPLGHLALQLNVQQVVELLQLRQPDQSTHAVQLQ